MEYNREPGDRYRMNELSFMNSKQEEKTFLLCVDYEKGVRVGVADMQGVFECDFSEYLEKMHEQSEPEYMYENTTNPDFEVVPVAILIDAVYSTPDTDKCTLFNWLDAIERRLVRVW